MIPSRVPLRPSVRAHGSPGSQGFTLVELMVSLVITAIVTGALYSVSRTTMDTFNQQQRTAEMQLRLRFAMEQIRADISRAGYMASPNSNIDPKVCPRPSTPVQGIEISRDSTFVVPNATANPFIAPVALRLVGNYDSSDEYLVASMSAGTINLQNQTPQWARVPSVAEFNRIFLGRPGMTGRLLRITTTNGTTQFVQVTGGVWQSTSGAALPQLTVSPIPAYVGDGAGAGGTCGIPGVGVGATVAPLSMVEYRLAGASQTGSSAYLEPESALTAGTAVYSTLKNDLVRRQYDLSPAANYIPGTERVVGEYAVDLDATISLDNGNSLNQPQITPLVFGDTNIVLQAGNVTAVGPSAVPQRVRSVVVRLSIRDRDQDSSFGFVTRTAATSPLTGFLIFPVRSGAARVRTLTAEIAMPNLANRNLR